MPVRAPPRTAPTRATLPRGRAPESTSATGAADLRVLVVAHLHPRLSRGGAEIAAYQMFEGLKAQPGVTAFFAAGAGGKLRVPPGVHVMQPFAADEFILANTEFNDWTMGSESTSFALEFRALVAELRPDVVHFHHTANLGLETLLLVRQAMPRARLIMTFHEFLPICHHYGQMVKRPGLELCHEATPQACARCFPERTENDFFLRRIYALRFLQLVDHFIAPSRFLADRYIAWGLDGDRLTVLENGQPDIAIPPGKALDPVTTSFGFFGQISKLKGVEILVEAALLLRTMGADPQRLRIVIHGDPSNQPAEFTDSLMEKMARAAPLLHLAGPYQHTEVSSLIRGCHAVLVPSIWWENSPLVIQEAFAAGRPVICSDIGGMAEKVRDGVDGFHFRARDPLSLARLLLDLSSSDALERVSSVVQRPPELSSIITKLLDIYVTIKILR